MECRPLEVKYIRKKDLTQTYLYKTKVHADVRLQRELNTLTIDELKKIAEDHNIELSTKRSKDPIISEIQSWLSTQTLSDGLLEMPAKFLNELPSIKIFRSSKTLNPESEVNQTLGLSFSTKIQTEKYSGRLADIQKEIKGEMVGDLRDFEEIVKRYCPDVVGIDVDPDFDFTHGFTASPLRLKRADGQSIDINKEGDGKKRRITLAAYEWREKILSTETPDDKQTIIAFDEPDTHLDYVSQRKILDIIRRITEREKNHVITSTHSLNLIDRVPITDVVHFRKEVDGTVIETLETEDPNMIDIFLYEISDCMGLKNSVMLNERCFLIVEGETELFSLPIIFNKLKGYSLQSGGIRLVNGEGCGGVKSVAKFLTKNKRNVMFMVDKDTSNNPNALFTAEKLKAEGFDLSKVFFTNDKEYENEFSDDVYARAANAYLKKKDGTTWQAAEFTAMRKTDIFAKELVSSLRRQTEQMVTKPEIGLAIAKSLESSEIPEAIKNCLLKALELSC